MAEEQNGSSGEASSSSFERTPLSEVFSNKSESHAEQSASEHEEETDKEEKGDQKFPVGESSPDEKDDKKASDQKDDKPDDKSSEKPSPDAKKDDAKPGDKKEVKPSDDKAKEWEVDDNPYKKRFQDTAANWNKEHQENLQLRQTVAHMQQDVVRLQKMADGTYDPEKDGPKEVTHEEVASRALAVGKVLASKNAAVSQFGLEKVNATIGEFNQAFEHNADINALVTKAESPVHEVFRIMDRYKFEQKYGDTPSEIHKNIRAEAEKELRETIRKEVTDEIMGRVDKKKAHPTFSSSRGSNGSEKGAKPKGTGPTPLKEVFGR